MKFFMYVTDTRDDEHTYWFGHYDFDTNQVSWSGWYFSLEEAMTSDLEIDNEVYDSYEDYFSDFAEGVIVTELPADQYPEYYV